MVTNRKVLRAVAACLVACSRCGRTSRKISKVRTSRHKFRQCRHPHSSPTIFRHPALLLRQSAARSGISTGNRSCSQSRISPVTSMTLSMTRLTSPMLLGRHWPGLGRSPVNCQRWSKARWEWPGLQGPRRNRNAHLKLLGRQLDIGAPRPVPTLEAPTSVLQALRRATPLVRPKEDCCRARAGCRARQPKEQRTSRRSASADSACISGATSRSAGCSANTLDAAARKSRASANGADTAGVNSSTPANSVAIRRRFAGGVGTGVAAAAKLYQQHPG